MKSEKPDKKSPKPNIYKLLTPYKGLISGLLLFALLSNGLNLVIPKIIEIGIDDFTGGVWNIQKIMTWFFIAVVSIFILSFVQGYIQTYASEKVAKDLRYRLSAKISQQDYNYIQQNSSSRLLTNLTSDVDAIKMFVS